MDELQNLWTTHSEKVVNELQLDETELSNQLIDKANNAIRQINRVMRIDAIIMMAITALFISITFIINLESKYSVSLLLLCMMMFLGVHYWIKHTLINNHDFKNENIANILNKKMKYLRWYERAYYYGIPIIFLGLYIYLQTILLTLSSGVVEFNMSTSLRYSLGIPATFLVHLLTKVFYDWLFGKELQTLESIVEKLNQ